MKVESLKDVLQWTASFHSELSNHLKQSTVNQPDTRKTLLLDYLAEHETKLAHVIDGYLQSADEGALTTWCMEFAEHHDIEPGNIDELQLDKMNYDEIVATVIDRHQEIIALFHSLAANIVVRLR